MCGRLNIITSFDSLDEEDLKDIAEEVKDYGQLGLTYAVYANGVDHEATGLGIEARDLAMKLLQDDGLNPFVFKFSDVQQIIFPSDYYDKMLQSPLGGFVDGLKHLSQSAVVAIALVDGGIERIKKDSADSCVTEMLKSFILPWDCLPNSLYVFGPHVQDHASSVG